MAHDVDLFRLHLAVNNVDAIVEIDSVFSDRYLDPLQFFKVLHTFQFLSIEEGLVSFKHFLKKVLEKVGDVKNFLRSVVKVTEVDDLTGN